MSDIPSDIVADFLSRVPALSLLRFRCVSKTWRSIIDSPGFVKLHLDRTLRTESDRKILLQGFDLFWADMDLVEETNRVHYTPLDWPFTCEDESLFVIGSCNGVLCLGSEREDEAVALWNPTTRAFFNIPSSGLTCPGKYYKDQGFGYDKLRNDYKVLRIMQRYDKGESETSVFSMKLKVWRKIDPFPFYLKYSWYYGVLASGSLHFICRAENGDAIIGAFDLETEEYRLVPPPDFPVEKRNYVMDLVGLGGSLCMTCLYRKSETVDIWVMKNYPAKESWTHLLTIRKSEMGKKDLGVYNVKPIAYSRSGGEVFMARSGLLGILLLWYDLEKRTIRFVDFDDDDRMGQMEHLVCCGSLVKLIEN